MIQVPGVDYNQQMAAIQQQLSQLKLNATPTPQIQPMLHQIKPVDGLAGAEAVLKEMPAGSSDIVAHKTEDIIYILARDEKGVPAPIQAAKIEFITAQEDPSGYVTKRDFDAFKEELKAMLAQKGETT